MTYEEKAAFLFKVRNTLEKEPELLNDTIMAINSGVQNHIKELRQQTADMETVAVAFQTMSSERYKKTTDNWVKNLLHTKLEKHKNKWFINWETVLEKLKKDM